MTPSVRTLQGSKQKSFRGSKLLCPRGSNTRGFSKRLCAIIYQVIAAQLNLNATPAAVFQMHHCVAFQTGIVPVVFYHTTHAVSINPQVSHGKILKEQSKTL